MSRASYVVVVVVVVFVYFTIGGTDDGLMTSPTSPAVCHRKPGDIAINPWNY